MNKQRILNKVETARQLINQASEDGEAGAATLAAMHWLGDALEEITLALAETKDQAELLETALIEANLWVDSLKS